MDHKFLEFWGNFFTQAAEGRKMMENVSAWMRQGFTGFEEMSGMFQKAYGLEKVGKGNPDYFALWKKAQEDFNKSYLEFLSLMGLVPRDQHLTLIKKYEDMKEQLSSQKETIEHLRMLLAAEKKMEHEEVTGKIQGLVQQQAEQFQKLMESFSQTFRSDEAKRLEKEKEKKKAKPPERVPVPIKSGS